MDVRLPKTGKYVVAVSGGVDSVVLLDILRRQPGLKLVVAHFDHGIRSDSRQDRELVEGLARQYDLAFIYEEGFLGAGISEASARSARYAFLRRVQKTNKAQAIITAHHQDDVLETAIINLLRGTGRKGLTSLANQSGIERPLLSVPKQALKEYAQKQNLQWREDSTNQDIKYLRNYVRHKLLPKFSANDRQKLLKIIESAKLNNARIDTLLVKYIQSQSVNNDLERSWFNKLPHSVAREVLAGWLRAQGIRDFDSKGLERLAVAAKTAPAGQLFPVLKGYNMEVKSKHLALRGSER